MKAFQRYAYFNQIAQKCLLQKNDIKTLSVEEKQEIVMASNFRYIVGLVIEYTCTRA